MDRGSEHGCRSAPPQSPGPPPRRATGEPDGRSPAGPRPPWGRGGQSGGPGGAPLPAATVVLVRPGAEGVEGVEVLMLRRVSTVAFGGMWVFPGGRVDPGDADPRDGGDELAAARRAAARETAEEAGLVVEPDALVTLSLWEPPVEAPRRYRTWFFVAPGPATAVAVDGGEIEEHCWMTPTRALADHAAGTIELAPPTWVTLWEIAADSEAGADVVAAAANRPPEHFSTRIASGSGGRTATLWQGDAGYGTADLDAPGPRRRLWLGPGTWRLEWTAARPGPAAPVRGGARPAS